MADQWHYRMLGEEFGPVTTPTLRSLLADGTIGMSDDVRRDGENRWQKARELSLVSDEQSRVESDEFEAADLDAMLAAAPAPATTQKGTSIDPGGIDLDAMLAPSAAPKKAEANDWYYRIGGRKFGPFDFDTLFEYASSGKFSRYDEIRAPGDTDWVEAQTIVGLFPDEQDDLASLLADAEAPQPPAPKAEKPVKQLWYYRVLNQEMGPVDFEGLFDLVVEGNLRPDDDIRKQEETDWQRADSLVGLFPDDMFGDTEAADDVDVEDDEEPEWYLKHEGKESGPVTFGRLVKMAADGKLQRTDQIRLTKLGSWMDAESMVGLFPEPEEPELEPAAATVPASNVPDRPEGDADDWAAAVLSEPAPEPPKPAPAPAAVPPPPTAAPTMPAATMGAGAAVPHRPAFTPPPKTRKSFSGGGISMPSGLVDAIANPKLLIGGGVLLAAVGIFFIPWGSLFGPGSSDLTNELEQIWTQVKALYTNEAPESEWTSLSGQVSPRLTEIAETAKSRGAGPANPGLQIAYLVASQKIPEVLEKKTESPELMIKTVDNFLTRAKDL